MRRPLTVLVLATSVTTLLASPADAGQARSYHVITSDLGYAVVDRTSGCLRTEAFVSSSAGTFASQPGPVTKQGQTSVYVRVTDVCAGTVGALAPAAGGGGPIVAEYDGQSGLPVVMDPRLRQASVAGVVPATDVNGAPVTLDLSAQWTGTGELDHSTGHGKELVPGVGVFSGASNDLRRAATAQVSLSVDGAPLLDGATATEAVLEQTKWHCVEVPRPGVEDFTPCTGLPG